MDPSSNDVVRTGPANVAGEAPPPQWPVGKDGFRIRGAEMTRTETFTDAAFAFAVTLLVISVDAIPSTYVELRQALADVPAFAASFVLLWFFWYGHWQWSRRFGLEDMPTIILSFTFVFVMLSYIYPMKFLATLSVAFFSGRSSARGMLSDVGQLYDLFAIYGIGFVTMALIIVSLNVHAYRKRERLRLDALERFLTRGAIGAWTILAVVGTLSVALALATEPPAGDRNVVWPGWVYMLLAVVMPVYGTLVGRRSRRIPRE
jgi:uncharacterized membrane protein